MSVLNALHRRREEQRYGTAVAKTRVHDAPLFVLGHWRTGTTFLHDLLARDTEQFAFPNSLQVTFPFTFLCTEPTLKRRSASSLPSTRPMDNVAISLETPQEDEFALCVASLRSPYPGLLTFPRRADHYDRYLTFRDVPEPEVEEWKATLLWFLSKLTFQYDRPLLLKSPTHTARVRLLLELFPRARFVHIVRDPYAVFQSTRHLFQSLCPIHILQRPPAGMDDPILRRYTTMFDAFFEERCLIPEGQYHEIRYEELVKDPVGQIGAAYEGLGLPGFAGLRPRLQAYVDSLSGYQANRHEELSPALRGRVATAWRRCFETWGYPV